MRRSALALVLAACGGMQTPAPWGANPPALEDELAILEHAGAAITSFRADAILNGSTAIEIEADADHIRLRTRHVELVCDGDSLTMIDHEHACARIDSCEAAVKRVLGADLSRDDLLHLASGSVPTIHCGPFAGEVTWDSRTAREHVDYGFEEANGERCTLEQRIEIDRRDDHRDVVAYVDRNGWLDLSRVEQGGFHDLAGGARVPAWTRYGDVRIDWRRVELNTPFTPGTFRLDLPDGMPTCP